MTKNNIDVLNTLTTPEQLKRACEYKTKKEKEKEEQEIRLLPSFIAWFNKEVTYIDDSTFLAKAHFTIAREDVPVKYWNDDADYEKRIFKSILDKYLNDAGWKCKEDNMYNITFRPL